MGREVLGAADEMDALLDGLMVLARSGRELPSTASTWTWPPPPAPRRGACARSDVRVRLELCARRRAAASGGCSSASPAT